MDACRIVRTQFVRQCISIGKDMMSKYGDIKRYRRFQGWDYSKGASLFITIATASRRRLFGKIVNGEVVLSPLGEKVKAALEAMPRLNPGLLLFGHVVMPDHVHFNCAIVAGLDEPLKTLGGAIRRFKNYTTALAKRSLAINAGFGNAPVARSGDALIARSDVALIRHVGMAQSNDGQTAFGQLKVQLWQQGYHDYILISREMIDSTERYIAYNPLKWEVMYGVGGGLRVDEPLCSPRLGVGDYWKGVGNISLLDDDVKMVSLRISREVSTPEAIARVVKRLESAVDKGYVVISGFISKGERAVRDMLCRRPDARFIRMLPSCIPNRRFKPESVYVAPFAEGRYLEIGRGNDEREFGRGACLDINAEIVEIATACEGLAVYWKADGMHVLAEHSSTINALRGGGPVARSNDGQGAPMSHAGMAQSNDGQTVFGQSNRRWL